MDNQNKSKNPMSQIALFLRDKMCRDTGLTIEQLKKSPDESVSDYKARILKARDKVHSDRLRSHKPIPDKDV